MDFREEFAGARAAMVREQIEARKVRDSRVLAAMGAVPRHRFVPEALRSEAYEDRPLPLGPGRTLSQPYIVAFMAEALRLQGGERILEVGSGSGYLLAVLSHLGAEALGVELDPGLAGQSLRTLQDLGCSGVQVRCGDGAQGWPEAAPFDAVLLSCAAEELPRALWDQLRPGGLAQFPQERGGWGQDLVLLRKSDPVERQVLLPVAFVPLRSPP